MLLMLVHAVHAGTVADCEQTWPATRIKDLAESAQSNLQSMDAEGYLATRDVLAANLPCIREPLGGDLVGSVHLIMATAASIEQKDAQIAPALAGLLMAVPGYQLSSSLYPDGHPVRALLSHASLLARSTATQPLPARSVGWFEADGVNVTTVPTERAVVVQEFDSDGAVVETRYIWPGDPLGTWTALPTAPPKVATKVTRPKDTARTTPGPKAGKSKARVPLLISAGVGAVATGVLYGVARDRYETFYGPDYAAPYTDDEVKELEDLRNLTNGLTIGTIVAGAATIGLGVGVVVAW